LYHCNCIIGEIFMPYEADPAGLGIGHRYGPRNLGGVAGVYRGDGAEREYIWELMAGEVDATPALTLVLPANYLVESVYDEVEEAFAVGSTAILSIGGGAGLTAAVSLATAVPLTEDRKSTRLNSSHVKISY